MYIRYVEIKNFRGISDFKANMSKNNILSIVGQNDVGKSSVLQALCVFFEKSKVGKEDFQKGNENSPIEIVVHFDCDGLDHLKHDGIIKLKQIHKKVNEKIICEKKIFSNFTAPDEQILQSYNTLKSLAKSLGLEVPTKKPDEEVIKQLRESVIETIAASPSSDWFDADWEQIEEYIPELIFIPASQDHEAEQKMSSDSSLFGRLFRVGIRNWLKADSESLAALQTINTKVETINNLFLKIVEGKLKEQLPLAEGLSQEIDPLDISKGFSFTMQVEDGQGVRTPLNQRGSGLQRAVLVAIIRAQSEINKEIEKIRTHVVDSGTQEEETMGRSNPVLYFFEEPEAFLHLSAQKDLFYSLKDLATQNSQIILTTHSTLFIDESDMDDVVLLVREQGKTISRQHIPQEDIRDQLGERVKLSELLTGKVCCLVEGLSDKFAFERWASRLGYDFKRQGIHFISMEGCQNMDYFANVSILNDFNVPFKIILDKDSHGETNSAERIKILKDKIPRLKHECFVLLQKGELENYFCIDTTASVLNISREDIDDEQYKIDPKKALEIATKTAIDAGSGNARKYQGTKHSKMISERMAIENLDEEIIGLISSLVKMSETNRRVIAEVELGLMQAAVTLEQVTESV
jgi:putative ATP-dependent endonuclease of OLD family